MATLRELGVLCIALAGGWGAALAQDDAANTAKGEAASKPEEPAQAKTEKAVFGGGCFWCLEAFYERVNGVKDVVSGYAGGFTKKPIYSQVLTGSTGHAEVVQIEFDPAVVSYDELLTVFWYCHDPTSLNRQGPDAGTQYRSIILYSDEAQRVAAAASMKKMDESGELGRPIVTEIVPLEAFYPAEKYHQDYYRKNKNAPYCRVNITPKLQALRAKFAKPAAEERKAESTKKGAGEL
jgi:peptide-methionine (S)-S-oxide reductase